MTGSLKRSREVRTYFLCGARRAEVCEGEADGQSWVEEHHGEDHLGKGRLVRLRRGKARGLDSAMGVGESAWELHRAAQPPNPRHYLIFQAWAHSQP